MSQYRKNQTPVPEEAIYGPNKGFLGLYETARMLGISPLTLKKIVKDERKITCFVIGKRYRFKLSDVNDYLERAKRHAIDSTEK